MNEKAHKPQNMRKRFHKHMSSSAAYSKHEHKTVSKNIIYIMYIVQCIHCTKRRFNVIWYGWVADSHSELNPKNMASRSNIYMHTYRIRVIDTVCIIITKNKWKTQTYRSRSGLQRRHAVFDSISQNYRLYIYRP